MTYTLLLARELKALSHDVTILSPGQHNERYTDESTSIVKLDYTKVHVPKIPFISRFLPMFHDRVQWMFSVRLFIKAHEPFDVIESPEWGSSTLLVAFGGKRNIITRMHKSLLQYHTDNNLPVTFDLLLINCLEMLSVILAAGITSPTHYMLRTHPALITLSKILLTPLAVIPNGVNINVKRAPRTTKTPYILTVGRLERGKGQLLLIRAFARIANEVPFTKLILIGRDTQDISEKKEGGFKKILVKEVQRLKLQKHVIIKEQMTQAQLAPYYQRCLVYVAPSLGHENHPLALLDAIKYGKAVIGSDTGGIPEIISHRHNGLLFQTNNLSRLAKSLKYLIQNSQVRTRYEKHNLVYRRSFAITRTTTLTLGFYRKALHLK